jgi:hypothetical protein
VVSSHHVNSEQTRRLQKISAPILELANPVFVRLSGADHGENKNGSKVNKKNCRDGELFAAVNNENLTP